MSTRYPATTEELAMQLIAAYERGETCPPATEEALREALPVDASCPPNCPYAARRRATVVLRLPVSAVFRLPLDVAENG